MISFATTCLFLIVNDDDLSDCCEHDCRSNLYTHIPATVNIIKHVSTVNIVCSRAFTHA